MNNISEKLEKVISKENIYQDELMSKHTSFRIGGKADYYLKVHNEDELRQILKLAKEENIPFQIVGNGTNILVLEGGIRGFIIKLELKDYMIERKKENVYITAGAGISLAKLSLIALENGFTGLEELSGIPGTIGGAIRMNAGAYGREMKDIVVSTKCMNEDGEIEILDNASHEFEYRKSAFEKNHLIILETTIKLEYGEKEKIQEKMNQYMDSRKKNQPLEFPNAGSTFKRNLDIPTSKLIDDCGLKGYKIGDAEVSTKHAGFIVNKGNATSKDVLDLTEYVKKEVKEKFGKDIKLEVLIMGEE